MVECLQLQESLKKEAQKALTSNRETADKLTAEWKYLRGYVSLVTLLLLTLVLSILYLRCC